MNTDIRIKIAAVIAWLLPIILFAQPEVEWERTYGGDDDFESCYDAIRTSDGGFLMVGSTLPHDLANPQKALALKVDENGDTLWSEQFGQSGDLFIMVYEAADDEYVLVGGTTVNQDWLAWLIKINDDREVLWTRTYSGQYGRLNSMRCIPTTDGGYCLTAMDTDDGLSWYAVYVLRTDDEGRRIWSRNYYWGESGVPYSIIQTDDAGFLIVGRYISHDREVGYAMKIDEDGREEWHQTLTAEGQSVCFYDAAEYSDDYLIVGTMGMILVNSEGEIADTLDLNEGVAAGDEISYTYGMTLLSDGGFLLIGSRWGDGNIGLFRTDQNLARLWTLPDMNVVNYIPYLMTLKQTADYGFVLGGSYYDDNPYDKDFYLGKLGPDPEFGVPRWVFLPDTGFVEDDSLTLDLPFLYDHLADTNTPDSLLLIAVESGDRVLADFDGERIILTAEPDWWGLDRVRLTVADPDSFSSSRYLCVTVTSVNDPPLPFTLLFPPDNSEITQPEMTFLWAEASQKPMETDSVQYRLFFRTPDYVYELPLNADRFYFVNDIRDILTALHPGLESPVALEWGVRAVDSEDSIICERDFTLNVNLPQSVSGDPPILRDFVLQGAYPNPFNVVTVIRYSLPHSGNTSLTLLESSGRLVATLVHGWQEEGRHEAGLAAGELPAGVYMARLDFAGEVRTIKLVCLK